MHFKSQKSLIVRFVLILTLLGGMSSAWNVQAAPLGIDNTTTVLVVSPAGIPLAGKTVYAFNGNTYTGSSDVTDANGEAAITLPEGSYRFRVDVEGTQFWSGAENHCNNCQSIIMTIPDPVLVTVQDTDGMPVANLNVYAFNSATYTGFHGTTNQNGQVSLRLLEGSYRFRADLNGTQFWSGTTNHCDIPGCDAASVTISKPMMVTVLDTDDAPKAGLNVYAFNGSTYTGYNKITNASGQAVFTLPLGSYRFRADLNGTQFWSGTSNHCDIPGCDSASVMVSQPMTVTVLDTDAAPKAGLNVYAFNGSTYTGYNKITNASGQALFTLPLGSYRFRADLNGTQFWSGTSNHCTLPDCESAQVSVTTPLTVVIREGGGVSKSGVNVYAFNGSAYTGYNKVSDINGQAVFTLPIGSYRFRADYLGIQYWSSATNHCALPGCLNTSVTIGPAMTATPTFTDTPIPTATYTSTPANTPTLTPTYTATSMPIPTRRVVTNTNDSGVGSLRQTVMESNSGDTITFAPSLAGKTITLSSGSTLIVANKKLTLDGAGLSPQVTIDGGDSASIILNGISSLDIYDLTISNLSNRLFLRGDATIRNSTLMGFADDVIQAYGSLTISDSILENNDGQAIIAYGPLVTITNSTLQNNAEGAVYSSQSSLNITDSVLRGNGGVAISAGGPVTVIGSTVMENNGQGLLVTNTLALVNSTIYQNAEEALMLNGGAGATIVNSTISHNQGSTGQIVVNGRADVDISNSIIVGNTNRTFLFNDGALDLHNSILVCTHDSECFLSIRGTVNWFDSFVFPNATWSELGLGEPADNGGSTPTMALLPGSFLIDAGDDAICASSPVNNRDQRGAVRPQGTHCDIGAYEANAGMEPSPTPTRTNTPTLTPTLTPIPTLTYTPAFTPTLTSTPVVGCSNIAVPAGQTIMLSGRTMYLNINNPMTYDVTISDVFVRWNYLQGANGSAIHLKSTQVNANVFWTGDVLAPSYSIPLSTPVILPANQISKLVFTFDKMYTRPGGEQIQIAFSTAGCEDHAINVIK